jgi:16S rRNA U1498 N3-methylase RsmE
MRIKNGYLLRVFNEDSGEYITKLRNAETALAKVEILSQIRQPDLISPIGLAMLSNILFLPVIKKDKILFFRLREGH